MTATFLPEGAAETVPGDRQSTGCLRCLLGEMPAPGTVATCDTAGVIGPAVTMVASIAATEAMKLIVGRGELNRGLIYLDLWSHEYENFGSGNRQDDCPACGMRRFDFLNAEVGKTSSALCGRNAVQVIVNGSDPADLARIETQLAPVATTIVRNEYLLKAQIDEYEFTVFPDNRAVIQGTDDEDLAKGLYARYIGG
jgi:adenylyltransferase/sulfurtransferase